MSTEKGVFLYANFDLLALLQRAEQLRGIPCSCNASTQPKAGSLNWAIVLLFEDGVEWVFRSPRESQEITPETTSKLLESEVATMRYVKGNSSIPVPEVFDYSCTSSNIIGLPFILMSKAPGFPLADFSWDAVPEGMTSRKLRPSLNRINKEKIIRQLGAITAQLLKLRFDKLGSLLEDDGEYRVIECLSPALLWHNRDHLGDDVERGPFQYDYNYYESLLSAFLLHVKELPLNQHAFFAPVPELVEFDTYQSYRAAVSRWNDFVAIGSKTDSSRNRLDYCIAGNFLRNLIQSICRTLDVEKGFPLYHPDLSTSNIFIDNDFNITCIIDWAFSSTVPISTLLMGPSLPHPRDELDTTLIPIFRTSFTDHFFQEREFTVDTEFWDATRRAWLFTRLVTLDGLQDYRYFSELYALAYKETHEIHIPSLFKGLRKEAEFIELARALEEDDLSAMELRRKEEIYFRYLGQEKEAIARKLTMIAELDEGFVADKRLWKWLLSALS